VTIDYLGARSAGGLIGWLYTSVALGTLIGPAAAGYIFDFTRSYETTIIIAVALAGLASGMTMLLRDPERWRAAQAAA
jgi:MFS family permease